MVNVEISKEEMIEYKINPLIQPSIFIKEIAIIFRKEKNLR